MQYNIFITDSPGNQFDLDVKSRRLEFVLEHTHVSFSSKRLD
jgi:hypothetical protein